MFLGHDSLESVREVTPSYLDGELAYLRELVLLCTLCVTLTLSSDDVHG